MREGASRPSLGIAAAALALLFAVPHCSGKDGCEGAKCGSGGLPGAGGQTGYGGASAGAGGSSVHGGASGGMYPVGAGAGGEEAGAAGEGSGCNECALYEFCRRGSCVSCSDIQGASFGVPENLHIKGRYPRPTEDGGLLFSAAGAIYFADASSAPPVAITDGVDGKDSAPLYVSGFETLVPNSNFFFLRTDASGSSLRTGYFLKSSPPTLTKVSPAPALFGSSDGFNYSLAISLSGGRAYWRTTRSELAGFVSALLAGDGSDIQALELRIEVAARTCPADEADPTAWVTPDGALLLLRQSILSQDCSHPLGFSTDLFGVSLEPASGAPRGPAQPLGVMPGGNARDSDPAFGPDCSLYFSTDAAANGEYELYRAARLR